jgi:hypothetical protein
MLRVVTGSCPNLLHEAGLYRWRESDSERESEEPDSGHNHALDALRYLVMGIDGGRPPRPPATLSPPPPPGSPPAPPPKPRDRWLHYRNEALWTILR